MKFMISVENTYIYINAKLNRNIFTQHKIHKNLCNDINNASAIAKRSTPTNKKMKAFLSNEKI